jgi:hypothetical protein
MPVFSALFVLAVLVAVAVPFSPAFFAIIDLAFGGSAPTNSDAGAAQPLLAAVDLGRRQPADRHRLRHAAGGPELCRSRSPRAMLYGGGMLALSLFGIVLVEGVL